MSADKPRGQWDAGTHAPNYAEGFALAENTPVTVPWAGPVAKDHTDFERERKEAERLAATNQPAAPAPPPRPVPLTLEDAAAVIARLVAPLVPVDESQVATKAGHEWNRTKAFVAAPTGSACSAHLRLRDVVTADTDLVGKVLLEKLVAERLRVQRLEENLRDLTEAVAVLVKAAKLEMRA